VSLRGQTTWWTPDQPVALELAVQASSSSALELAVTFFRRTPNRTEFASSVTGRVAGRPIVEVPPVPVADAPTDPDGDVVLTFVPELPAPGVYPMRIELRPLGGGKAVDSFVTHLVRVPTELEADELSVAVVVPVHAPPAVQADGGVAIDDARAEQLAELVASLDAHPQVDLTLAPTPETVEALAGSPRDEDRATLATLVRALRDRQLLGGPWVPTNLTSLLAAGLDQEAAAQLTRGTDTLRRFFGRDPTTALRVVDERLDDGGVAFLRSQQRVERVVVPEALLEPIERRTSLTQTFQVDNRRGALGAAMADTQLAAHFAERDPALGAQHLLADLAVLYNDQTAVRGRGAVAAPPASWVPSRAFTDALLGGIATSPILEATSLDRFFAAVPAATTGTGQRAAPLVRRLAPAPAGSAGAPSLPGTSIASSRRRIDAFASAVDTTDPRGVATVDRLDRTLLAAESAELRPRDRTRRLDGVADQLQSQIAAIAMPQNRSITLTAREGELPVTITSGLGYPIRAVLRVESDSLDFPDGSSQPLDLVRRNTTAQFSVEAPSSGSFPVHVRLESPEGLLLRESRFTVRSTAISGVGTVLSIGAGVFLLIWWGNHLRGRRSRRLVPA
jgi:hypothetical protein